MNSLDVIIKAFARDVAVQDERVTRHLKIEDRFEKKIENCKCILRAMYMRLEQDKRIEKHSKIAEKDKKKVEKARIRMEKAIAKAEKEAKSKDADDVIIIPCFPQHSILLQPREQQLHSCVYSPSASSVTSLY
jgi:hypothetical protein